MSGTTTPPGDWGLAEGEREFQFADIPRPARERGLVAPRKFSRVVLKTTMARFDDMVGFWTTMTNGVCALRTQNADSGLALIAYDDEHHRMAIVGSSTDVSAERRPGDSGLDHVAFSFDTLDALMEQYARLRDEHGIRPSWSVPPKPRAKLAPRAEPPR